MRAFLNSIAFSVYTTIAILYIQADKAFPAAMWSAGAGIFLALTVFAVMEEVND